VESASVEAAQTHLKRSVRAMPDARDPKVVGSPGIFLKTSHHGSADSDSVKASIAG
jgi:hypothetical protein